MHDDTASRFTLSASRHSNYECELSLNSSCERIRSYCQTCTCFVVVKRHHAVTHVACRLQSAPNGCGNAPYPASLASCGAIATPQVVGVARAAAMHIAIATCAALRGELSERNARRSTRNRNRAAARSTRMHVQSHLVRLRNFGTCHVQLAIGVAASCFPQRAASALAATSRWDCGCDGCITRSAIFGGCHGDAWQDNAHGAQKKTVAAATAATTVIDLPARLTWSRGGRTCSESTSAACRCRPCPAAR